MKKVIVFRVEGVLVKKYDVKSVYGLKMKKMVKEKIGGLFDDELKRRGLKGNGFEELMSVVEGLEKRFEESGLREKMWELRGVKRVLVEMNERGDERMVEMEREYFEEGFEKRKIVCGDVLRDLEKVGDVLKGFKVVFVSGFKKGSVERLLLNNGLRKVRVVGSVEELGDVEKEKMVFFGNKKDVVEMEERGIKCVEGVKNVFGEIGLRKVEEEGSDVVDCDNESDSNGNDGCLVDRDNCICEKEGFEKDFFKNEYVIGVDYRKNNENSNRGEGSGGEVVEAVRNKELESDCGEENGSGAKEDYENSEYVESNCRVITDENNDELTGLAPVALSYALRDAI